MIKSHHRFRQWLSRRGNELWTLIQTWSPERVLGAGLSLTLVYSCIFWWSYLPRIQTDLNVSVCWPGLNFCSALKNPSEEFWQALLVIKAALGAMAGIGFLLCRGYERAALRLLAIGSVIKLGLYLLDYRLMGNFHSMPIFLSFIYILRPKDLHAAQLTLVMFYFLAGTLKLNLEWLSGQALWTPRVWTMPDLMPWGLAGVVILELCLIWLLLMPSRILKFLVWLTLVAFHCVSYNWVGWFYPAIMLTMILFMPMMWRRSSPGWRLTRWGIGSVLVLLVAHGLPHVDQFQLRSTPLSLEGSARAYTLNMIDARPTCVASLLMRIGRDRLDVIPNMREYGVRTSCDPLLLKAFAISLCRSEDSRSLVQMRMASRRGFARQAEKVISEQFECGELQ